MSSIIQHHTLVENWVLISNYCRSQENVDLYIHSPIRLQGIARNQLSTGATLPFTLHSNGYL
jgi:hypothetical protein